MSVESKTYRETTDVVKLSPQSMPFHEQKSALWTSSQSSNRFATFLNEALIDINAFPAQHISNTIYQLQRTILDRISPLNI